MWATLILAEKLSQQLYQQWQLSQITWRNGEFILIYYQYGFSQNGQWLDS